MNQIVGVGAGKAIKYGKPFVELIGNYVEENEIARPMDMVVKTMPNKSGLKVYIIQNIDRKLALEDIAAAKQLSFDEMLDELESVVASGTRLDINYYIDDIVEPFHAEEIFEYFKEEAKTDSVEDALEELGADEYTEQEIRLVRIKFMSDVGN